jgi:hypothetical protein
VTYLQNVEGGVIPTNSDVVPRILKALIDVEKNNAAMGSRGVAKTSDAGGGHDGD